MHKLYGRFDYIYFKEQIVKHTVKVLDKTKKFIKKWNNSYINDNIDDLITTTTKNQKNNAQEAHEAIRPTDINKSYIFTSDKIILFFFKFVYIN